MLVPVSIGRKNLKKFITTKFVDAFPEKENPEIAFGACGLGFCSEEAHDFSFVRFGVYFCYVFSMGVAGGLVGIFGN
jgi:hypothetical protein